MFWSRSFIAGSALFSLLFVASPEARAENPPPAPASESDQRAKAKARYQEGARAFSEGRYKDAVDLFLEADRIVSSAPLSFNIARAYEKLGDGSQALAWYRDYLRRDPQAKNAAAVQASIQALEDRLAARGLQQLTIRSTPKGATVLVDDQPVGVTPWTGDLPPGTHRVLLSLKGYGDASREVELPANDALDVEIPLEEQAPVAEAAPTPAAPAPAVAPVAAAPASEGIDFGPWPIVTLAAGGAFLGGALAFELSRRSAEDDADAERIQVGYAEKYDSMEARQTTARVLAGVGGALVVASGVMLLLELNSPGESASKKTAIGLGCAGPSCGAALKGSF